MTTFIPSLTLPSQVFSQPASAILLPLLLGNGIGFIVAPKEAQSTYMALKQPPYRPPPQIFAPVWTALYGMMGYAAYRAYTTGMSAAASPQQTLSMKVNSSSTIPTLNMTPVTKSFLNILSFFLPPPPPSHIPPHSAYQANQTPHSTAAHSTPSN